MYANESHGRIVNENCKQLIDLARIFGMKIPSIIPFNSSK